MSQTQSKKSSQIKLEPLNCEKLMIPMMGIEEEDNMQQWEGSRSSGGSFAVCDDRGAVQDYRRNRRRICRSGRVGQYCM